MVIGSPAYMAPEQARGEPTGPPADLWALGATLYFAVEGQLPFDNGASMATLAAAANQAPRPMRRAGPLALLLTALLAKGPHRPSLWPQGPGLASLAPGGGAISTHRDPPDPQTRSCRAARAATFHLRADPSSRHGGRWPLAAVPEAVGVRARPDSGFGPSGGTGAGPAAVAPGPPGGPTVPHRAGRRLLGVVGLLLVGGVLTAADRRVPV